MLNPVDTGVKISHKFTEKRKCSHVQPFALDHDYDLKYLCVLCYSVTLSCGLACAPKIQFRKPPIDSTSFSQSDYSLLISFLRLWKMKYRSSD